MSPYKQLTLGKQSHVRKGIFLKCETCSSEFYVYPSRISQAEKNKVAIRFCSKKCYVKTQANNPFFGKKHSADSIEKMSKHPNRPRFGVGENNPNFVRFGNDFFPTNGWGARKRLIHENLKTVKCEDCGYNEIPEILQIHHKDRNRQNNGKDNLAILCPNCHFKEHLLKRDGWFKHAKWLDD